MPQMKKSMIIRANITVLKCFIHLPYAEIGAGFQQWPFWSIVVGGLIVVCVFLSLVVLKIL